MEHCTSKFNVMLIDTNPEGLKGSMAQYGDIVAQTLSRYPSDRNLTFTRLRLALPNNILSLLPGPLRNPAHHLYIMLALKLRIRKQRMDIFHILDGSHAYVAQMLPEVPVMVTVHDVIPALLSRGDLNGCTPSWTGRWLIRQSLEGVKKACRIFAVSKNTADELNRITGIPRDFIDVIHLPLSPAFRNVSDEPVPSWLERKNQDMFMLHVGNNAFYKNRIGVLRIFARIRKSINIRMIMAGAAPTADLRKTVRDLGIDADVEFVIDPDASHLIRLYRNACLLLFPSLYEGFGWPPIEAMACGCPVVCSNAGSLPEIVGDAAMKCLPYDEAKMADNCVAILNDEKIAMELIERGFARKADFTMAKTVEGLLDNYTEILNKRASAGINSSAA